MDARAGESNDTRKFRGRSENDLNVSNIPDQYFSKPSGSIRNKESLRKSVTAGGARRQDDSCHVGSWDRERTVGKTKEV